MTQGRQTSRIIGVQVPKMKSTKTTDTMMVSEWLWIHLDPIEPIIKVSLLAAKHPLILLAGPTHSPSRNISASERFTGLCLNHSHRSFQHAIWAIYIYIHIFSIFTAGFHNFLDCRGSRQGFQTEHKTTTWLYASAERNVLTKNTTRG